MQNWWTFEERVVLAARAFKVWNSLRNKVVLPVKRISYFLNFSFCMWSMRNGARLKNRPAKFQCFRKSWFSWTLQHFFFKFHKPLKYEHTTNWKVHTSITFMVFGKCMVPFGHLLSKRNEKRTVARQDHFLFPSTDHTFHIFKCFHFGFWDIDSLHGFARIFPH